LAAGQAQSKSRLAGSRRPWQQADTTQQAPSWNSCLKMTSIRIDYPESRPGNFQILNCQALGFISISPDADDCFAVLIVDDLQPSHLLADDLLVKPCA